MDDIKTIKRYANRKLYDTQTSRYVTLEDIAEMVKSGEELRIIDNRTEEDLTSMTLAQIILEEEKKNKPILPKSVLRDIIRSSSDFLGRLRQPVVQFREEAEKKVDIIRRSTDSIEEARGHIREFLDHTQTSLDEMSHRIDERIKDFLGTFSSPSQLKEEINSLNERLNRLETELRDLKKTLDTLNEPQAAPRIADDPDRKPT